MCAHLQPLVREELGGGGARGGLRGEDRGEEVLLRSLLREDDW